MEKAKDVEEYITQQRAALATTGSTRFRRIPALYCCLRCGDLRSPGVTQRRDGPLGLRNDDDDMSL